MIDIEALIYSRLGPLVADRCYPGNFEQPPDARLPTWPAIRFMIIDSTPEADICGTDNEDTDDIRVQVDVAGLQYDDVRLLKKQVINELMNTDPPCTREAGGGYFYDDITKTHRFSLDFLFCPSSTVGSP